MLGTRCEYYVLVQTKGESYAAIAVQTYIRVWTGASSGANGRVLEQRRAHVAIGVGGYKLTLPQLYFCQFLFQISSLS